MYEFTQALAALREYGLGQWIVEQTSPSAATVSGADLTGEVNGAGEMITLTYTRPLTARCAAGYWASGYWIIREATYRKATDREYRRSDR
jgi:hypothetical protein